MVTLLLANLVHGPGTVEEVLSRPVDAEHRRFNAKDESGRGLDCLKVQPSTDGGYLGVHHTLESGVFRLHLVESKDLLNWRFVAKIDDHAHQGTLFPVGRRWVLAWEKDGPDGNFINLAAYDSAADLRANRPAKSVSLPRQFSPSAEGTPNIRRVIFDEDWSRSQVDLGFHFWRNSDVDRQAFGWISGFEKMTYSGIDKINDCLEATYQGNIGDRDEFEVGGRTYRVLEAQYKKADWGSWRILFGEPSGKLVELKIATPGRSTSFANPAVTALMLPTGKPGLFVSYFLPSQGNAKGESGQLIYYRELKDSGRTSSTSN